MKPSAILIKVSFTSCTFLLPTRFGRILGTIAGCNMFFYYSPSFLNNGTYLVVYFFFHNMYINMVAWLRSGLWGSGSWWCGRDGPGRRELLCIAFFHCPFIDILCSRLHTQYREKYIILDKNGIRYWCTLYGINGLVVYVDIAAEIFSSLYKHIK